MKALAMILAGGVLMTAATTPARAATFVPAGKGGDLPANQWVTLYHGPRYSVEVSRINATPLGPVMWPALAKDGERLFRFSVSEGKWTDLSGRPEAAPGQKFSIGYGTTLSPVSSTYLPAIKKLLVLQPRGSKGTSATSWLVDPESGKWEPVSDLAMNDKPSEFGTVQQKHCMAVPFRGALVYDAVNREALSCGGGEMWGRVGREKELVRPGDWAFDEKLGRIRRVTADDGEGLQARRWFPGHAGTWVFSEEKREWRPIAQPLSAQPGGRLLPGMAFDLADGKVVLFGGDDDARVLGDTWVYDCKTRTWSQAAPKGSPPGRAGCAMVYVPGQKLILMAGGYSGGWRPLKDVWTFSTATGEWKRLDLDLPEPARQCSGCYDEKAGAAVVYATNISGDQERVLALRLEAASAPAAPAGAADPRAAYHSLHYYEKAQVTPLPDEWLAGKLAPEDPKAVRAALDALPANVWQQLKPPQDAPARVWGVFAYDPRSHRAFAWGGGHYGYDGSEVNEYDLPTNRWRGMAEPSPFRPVWTHGSPGGPNGLGFGGWAHNSTHTRKSIAVDPASGCLINPYGDLYSQKHHLFVGTIGRCPGKWSVGNQPAYVAAGQDLLAYGPGGLFRANVAEGRWDKLADGGPRHSERHYLCHDSGRDRLVYFAPDGAGVRTWQFDLKAKQWSEDKPEGRAPAGGMGDAAYIPELDAALLTFSEGNGEERMYFYKPGEKRWYSAGIEGARPPVRNDGLSNMLAYDPELKLAVRLHIVSREREIHIYAMRVDPAKLKMDPLK